MLTKSFAKKLLSISRSNKKLMAVTLDLVSIALSGIVVSYLSGNGMLNKGVTLLLPILLFQVSFLVTAEFLNVYATIIRFVGYKFVITLAKSTILAGILTIIEFYILIKSSSFFKNYLNIEYSIILEWVALGFFLMGVWRWLGKFLINRNSRNFITVKRNVKKIAIYGAGKSGRLLATMLEGYSGIKCLCYVDDDEELQERYIGKLKVFSTEKFERVFLADGARVEVWLAIKSITKHQISEIVNKLQKDNCRVRIVNSLDDLFENKIDLNQIRKIEVEDILGREPIKPIDSLAKKNTQNKVILVTGAGGSIGSEIARQVAENSPEKIILFETSEYSLFKINEELNQLKIKKNYKYEIIPLLGSVVDWEKFNQVVSIWKPKTVYHAAAYKHVHLVEKNVIEGMKNNFVGTKNCLEISCLNRVENFVLISTDKAVRPTNVMGLTKRVCELLTMRMSTLGDIKVTKNTNFSIVRFGNVLGSSGSVMPIFKEQIERGGPVTVTDQNVTRFFMTMKEAAQLVIQAGALTNRCDLFILDMGEPVRINDLAVKMVKLFGKKIRTTENPDGIEVVFTGLKNGEKMHEELYTNHLEIMDTEHPRIKRIKTGENAEKISETNIQDLMKYISSGDVMSAIQTMTSMVPESEIVLRDDLYLRAMSRSI